MRKSFQCQIFLKTCFIVMFLCIGCGSAKTGEPDKDQEPQRISSASVPSVRGPMEHKARPTYITPALHEKWIAAKLEQRMRLPVNADKRVFFTTKSERDKKETFSVLDTRDGYMVNGRSVPVPSTTLRQLPVPYERGIAYGTTEFINLLTHVSKKMQKKFPHTIMYLGNLGLREGGDIPYSVSHNSGRDGDIGFYLKDEQGKFANPMHLHKINRNFQSREAGPKYTFDIEKNAALIETLLTQEVAPLQFIFVARHLRTAIRKELATRPNAEDLLVRFDAVVNELASHDDHFHIRIYCSNDDICAGCVDKSIVHEWISDPVAKQEACISKHLKTLASKKAEPEEKAAALQRLSLMQAASRDSARVIKSLNDEDNRVRAAAAMASASIGEAATAALTKRLLLETDSLAQLALLDALAKHDSAQTAETLAMALDQISEGAMHFSSETVSKILRHITHHPRESYVPALIRSLRADRLAPFKHDVVLTTEVVTNHVLDEKSGEQDDPAAAFEKWFEKSEKKTRSAWLIAGFKSAGYAVTNLQTPDVPALLDAVDAPSRAHSVNAQLLLKQLSHLPQDSLDWSVDDARWHYTRYFKRKAKKLKINLDDRDERGHKLGKN